MSPARRACNWEQGEWARPADRRFGLIAAATARPGNTWQARSCQRIVPLGCCAETDDGQQNRGYVSILAS